MALTRSTALADSRQQGTSLSSTLMETALSRLAFQHRVLSGEELTRAETLERTHTEMAQDAKEKFGIDFDSLPQPHWLQRELRTKQHLPQDLDCYINKHTYRAQLLAKEYRTLLKDAPEGPFVDIGTGSGFFPYYLKLQSDGSRHISGLALPDTLPTTGHAELDFRKGPEPLVKEYDGGQMPYADGSLASVGINCVLHHIEKPTRDPQADSPEIMHFLSEVKRVLKPGGTAIVIEDYMGKDKQERERGNLYADTVLGVDDLFYPQCPGSQRSQQEWVDMLTKAGFEVELEKQIGAYTGVGIPQVELVMKIRKPA